MGLEKDNTGVKILLKYLVWGIGNWLNGVAIHLFKEYRKKK